MPAHCHDSLPSAHDRLRAARGASLPGRRSCRRYLQRPRRARIYCICPVFRASRFVDHTLVAGFKRGILDADIEIYDWTEHDPGIPALQATGPQQNEAELIADQLTARFRADPRSTIDLTSHSGGAGLAAWAMEDLPPDVKIQTVIFLAPALSPGYDLSRAPGMCAARRMCFSATATPSF